MPPSAWCWCGRCILLQALMPAASFLSALTGPFQTENVPPRRPPSWVPSGSLPSGRDIFVQQLFRWPTELVFARVWAALQQFVGFVLALLWCYFWFAPALWWHRIRRWFVHFALALSQQRLFVCTGHLVAAPCALARPPAAASQPSIHAQHFLVPKVLAPRT